MKIINKLLKISNKENAKTIDEAIAYMRELEAERDEEMTERMRLEEHLHIARRFLSAISAEIHLQLVKAEKANWQDMLQELEDLQKAQHYIQKLIETETEEKAQDTTPADKYQETQDYYHYAGV